MCGLPLLYLERCGHKMTPRFPAPGNTSIYLYTVPYIELSIYRGWQEVTGKQPELLIEAIFFDAVKTYCYILMRTICLCVCVCVCVCLCFFFFFFFKRARVLASTRISDKSHSWLANSSPLEVTRVPL